MIIAPDILLNSSIVDTLALQSEKLRRLSRGRSMSLLEAGELMDETGRLYLGIAIAIREAIVTSRDGAEAFHSKYDSAIVKPLAEIHPG
jgi:hypothetical protein